MLVANEKFLNGTFSHLLRHLSLLKRAKDIKLLTNQLDYHVKHLKRSFLP